MSLQKVAQAQCQLTVNVAAESVSRIQPPKGGWIKLVRKALNMSGAQLARRMGVTRALVSRSEKGEQSGSITLKSLEQMAKAMGCKLVYTIVPEVTLEDIVDKRAYEKAKAMVDKTSVHMALEKQSLSRSEIEKEIGRLQKQLAEEHSKDLWND
jgi:predicted DNA-binding mobile mystery protein A